MQKAEVVRSDGHSGLLTKFNDRIERECEDMKDTIKTLRMTVEKENTNHHQPV